MTVRLFCYGRTDGFAICGGFLHKLYCVKLTKLLAHGLTFIAHLNRTVLHLVI